MAKVSTSFRFRGGGVDPRQVGRDLGVGAVLTERVSQRGDTLVIGAELVDVARGTQLWGERYSTRMSDIFAIEEDIARDISRSLRLKLAQAVELDPLSPQRHVALSFALYFGRECDQALEPLREATKLDPGFNSYFLPAWIHREKGMYEKAIDEFEMAGEKGPSRIHILGHLGNAYARAGRAREARE